MRIGVQYASLSTFTALCVTLSGMTLLLTLALLRKPFLPKEIWGTFWAWALQVASIYGFATWINDG
ncbi:MAG TPA: hypothetical protein V6D18_12170 [Thermosynechococcaceae cyanobacterium]